MNKNVRGNKGFYSSDQTNQLGDPARFEPTHVGTHAWEPGIVTTRPQRMPGTCLNVFNAIMKLMLPPHS